MRTRIAFISALFLLFIGQIAYAQVTGVVQDGDGFPVADAEVTVKGTENSVYTGGDGSFSIDAQVGDQLVVVGSDGLPTEFPVAKMNMGTLKIGGAIILKPSTIVGFGISETAQQKTGAYNTISSEDLEAVGTVSFDQALQGQAPGIQVGAMSGQPGSYSPMFIRGLTSLTGSTRPLVVINGVPVLTGDNAGVATTSNPLANIDPTTIESVTILKDAVSTSLYGARGANGVILVTLKKGIRDQSKFTLNTEFGFGNVAFENDDLLNAQEHADFVATALYNGGYFNTYEDAYNYNYFDWDGETDTDWRSLTRRNSTISEKYTLNYQGGGDVVKLYSSLSYFKQNGVDRKATYDRISGYLNAQWQASDKLSLGFDMTLSSAQQQGPTDASNFSNPVFTGSLLSPTQNPYNEDGSYNLNLNYLNKQFNPIAIQNTNINDSKFYKVLASINGSYDIMPFLTFDSNFGLDFNYYDELLWWNPDFGDGVNNGDPNGDGTGLKTDRNFLNWIFTNSLNFNKKFNSVHDVSATLAIEASRADANYAFVQKQGYPYGGTLPHLANAANTVDGTSRANYYSFLSYVARVAYSFDRRYSLNANFRRDGSSRFGQSNRYGNFWGAGVAWNLDQEEFLKNTSVKQLKLRASYGQVGNAEIGNYASRALYSPSGGDYLQSPAGYISQPGNPKLGWETTTQLNLGADFNIFNGFLSGSVDWYEKVANDLLYNVPITTPSSGFSEYPSNIGSVSSKGVETMLTITPVDNKNFSWSITANYSYNWSRIEKLSGADPSVVDGFKALSVGHNPTEFYTRLWAGVNKEDGTPLWYTDETRTEMTGNVNEAALSFTGKQALPTHIGGVTNTINYKGFVLRAQFSYAGGHSVYDRWGFVGNGDGTYARLNTRKEWVDNAWTPDNTDGTLPQVIWGGNNSSNSNSTRYLYDADNIRFRSAEIGYKFSKRLLGENSPIDGVYVYVKGLNLYTWTFDDRLYFDPEVASNAYTSSGYTSDFAGSGIYDQSSPNLRQYLFGVLLEF